MLPNLIDKNTYIAIPKNNTVAIATTKNNFDKRKSIVLYIIYATTMWIPNQNIIIGDPNSANIIPPETINGRYNFNPLAPSTYVRGNTERNAATISIFSNVPNNINNIYPTEYANIFKLLGSLKKNLFNIAFAISFVNKSEMLLSKLTLLFRFYNTLKSNSNYIGIFIIISNFPVFLKENKNIRTIG